MSRSSEHAQTDSSDSLRTSCQSELFTKSRRFCHPDHVVTDLLIDGLSPQNLSVCVLTILQAAMQLRGNWDCGHKHSSVSEFENQRSFRILQTRSTLENEVSVPISNSHMGSIITLYMWVCLLWTYPPHLDQVGYHDNGCRVLLPNHLPEVVCRLLHGTWNTHKQMCVLCWVAPVFTYMHTPELHVHKHTYSKKPQPKHLASEVSLWVMCTCLDVPINSHVVAYWTNCRQFSSFLKYKELRGSVQLLDHCLRITAAFQLYLKGLSDKSSFDNSLNLFVTFKANAKDNL